MKRSLFLFCAVLATSFAYGQSNYVTTYLDNPNPNADQLFKLPWDNAKLLQVRRDVVSGVFVYSFDEVESGFATAFEVPLCSAVTELPVVLDDGILVFGQTVEGIEPVFYNGQSSIPYDLNAGVSDSDPVSFELNDRVFVIAASGGVRQLFEFDKVMHTFSQITNEVDDVQDVSATKGASVYYSTKYANLAIGEDEYTLRKANLVNGTYVYSSIQMIGIPSVMNRWISWESPLDMWGVLYLAIVSNDLSPGQSGTIGVMNVDQNDQISTISQVVPYNAGEFYLLEWNGSIVLYSQFSNEMYTTSDGQNFATETIPAGDRIVEHHVSENDRLYFRSIHPDETHELFEFNNGFQSIHADAHMHFLLEANGAMYYSNVETVDSSAIFILYTANNVLDQINVLVGSHSPFGNSAVMHEGLFTFLHSSGGFYDDNKIYQITGAPSAGMEDLSLESMLYPNPISEGEVLLFESNAEGFAQVMTSDGRVQRQVEIHLGKNQIDLSSVASGVYFISFKNDKHRIVVN